MPNVAYGSCTRPGGSQRRFQGCEGMTDAHRYTLPSWDCEACGQPWPCVERKAKFLHDYEGQPGELRLVMSLFFIDATEDLTESVEEVHTRFVSWTIPARR